MAAINTIVNLLEAGDHVIATNDLYGGTYRLFTTLYRKFGLEFTFVDMSNVDAVREAIRPNTKLLMTESPSNLPPALIVAAALRMPDMSLSILRSTA